MTRSVDQALPQRRVVEVLGPWVQNKGDDLMLRAVVERLGERYRLVASPDLSGHLLDQPDLRRLEWQPTAGQYALAARQRSVKGGWDLLKRAARLALMPQGSLEAQGVIDGRGLQALLDCSGFAYGDQWSTRRVKARAAYYAKLKGRGVRLVLLPQALGPFDRPEVREEVRAMLAPFDLIYARDEASLKHVRALQLGAPRTERTPDITHLLDGTTPQDATAWASRVCVVPNARMVDRTTPEVGGRYVDFMARCVRAVREGGLQPVIVLHETNDVELVREITGRLGFDVPVLDEDAQVTKGYLGACYANVGSRYHSLIGSLSQGTPSLGTSWTHKYEALFAEYGCPDLSLPLRREMEDLDRAVHEFLAPARQAPLRRQLGEAAEGQKARVEQMWQSVENVLVSTTVADDPGESLVAAGGAS